MYVVAIPSYNRAEALDKKTLATLKRGKVPASKIHIFVANKTEEKIYKENVPQNLYHKIVVGKLGISNQRNFIKKYFKEGQYVVSIDDDVERLFRLQGEKEITIANIDGFFKKAYQELKKHKLFLWGIYPIGNTFFMKGKNKLTTDLRFIIGVLHGYIVRNQKGDRSMQTNAGSEGKEDYEQTLLYYLKDGGVIRFNDVAAKTRFFAPGGLGDVKKRIISSKKAVKYLKKTYPDYITVYHRDSGMAEVKFVKQKNGAGTTKKIKSTKKKRTLQQRRKTKKKSK